MTPVDQDDEYYEQMFCMGWGPISGEMLQHLQQMQEERHLTDPYYDREGD